MFVCFFYIAVIYGKFINPEISSSIELFKIGVPISFGVFVELSMFSGAALIISFFGATALAGHTIALNLVGLLFMLPLSLGLASAIRVGNLIGEKNYTQANYATNFSLKYDIYHMAHIIWVFKTNHFGKYKTFAYEKSYGQKFIKVAIFFTLID